jgi:hypothetical protein
MNLILHFPLESSSLFFFVSTQKNLSRKQCAFPIAGHIFHFRIHAQFNKKILHILQYNETQSDKNNVASNRRNIYNENIL